MSGVSHLNYPKGEQKAGGAGLFASRIKNAKIIFIKIPSSGTMDKRAHHNALERKRRDHIKDSFTGLRDAIPTMKGGDKSSRAQILKKASEYIQVLMGFLEWHFFRNILRM